MSVSEETPSGDCRLECVDSRGGLPHHARPSMSVMERILFGAYTKTFWALRNCKHCAQPGRVL